MTKVLGFSEKDVSAYYANGILHRLEPFTEPVADPLPGWK
jgi:hypothetical protein